MDELALDVPNQTQTPNIGIPHSINVTPSPTPGGQTSRKSRAVSKFTKCCECFLSIISLTIVCLTFPFSMYFCLYVIHEYEHAYVIRLGRVKGRIGPGLIFILPCIDDLQRVELRTQILDIPQQEILTKDKILVTVNAVVYYIVVDPFVAISTVKNVDKAMTLLSQTTLRTYISSKLFSECLASNKELHDSLDMVTYVWGLRIQRVEIVNIRLQDELQKALTSEAEASRRANTQAILASGEETAAMALKKAANIITESEGGMQLRYLQTLHDIAGKNNSTIVFPLPMDLIAGFVKRKM